MKILLVHNRYQQPGGEDIVFDQERALLSRAGHEVVLYQRSNLELDDALLTERIALVKNIVFATKTHEEFSRLLAREKPQLVHIHNTFVMVSPSVYLASEAAGIPVVQTLHNYRLICPAANLFRDGHICEECVDHTLWRGVRHGCYRDSRTATASVAAMLLIHRRRHTWDEKVQGYIALTEFARNRFEYGGLPADRLFVKPNFVYPDPEPSFSPETYGVFVGRLADEKRVSTLLDAWSRLKSPIPLLIIGDGPERKKLEAQVVQLGLRNVSLLGRLTREESLAKVKRAFALILPSECYENFPLTIAEAFACGTPVICSRLGAMQEIVDDGRTGLQFTPGDADDIASKVEWAWAHPDRMNAMRYEARSEYESKYTAERNYELLTNVYQRVLGHTRPALPKPATATSAPRRNIIASRTSDLAEKAWAYLLTALREPYQLLSLPRLCVNQIHIGEFLKLNQPWLKNAGIKTVIDAGAHAGEFSSAIHAVIPDAKIYAFEPLPDSSTQLRKKLGRNGSVRVFQVALGEENGSVDFWRSSFSKSSSVLPMSELHQSAFPWSADNRPITVKLRKLDEYLEQMQLAAKTLLKIDVQGYEDRVLRGAVKLLEHVHYVIVEVSIGQLYEGQANFHAIYDILAQFGFSYLGNLEQLASPVDGTILQVDALFARA